jgi:hypothetical protein
MFTISIIDRSYFPETPEIRIDISSKFISSETENFLIDVPALIAVLALVWEFFYGLSMCSLIFNPCFRHTVECTKVGDTSTQLKQTAK